MKSAVAVALSLLIVCASLPAAAYAQSITSQATSDAITAEPGGFVDCSDDVRVTAGPVSVGGQKLGVARSMQRQSLQSVVPAKKSHHIGRWIAIGAAAFGAVMLVWFIHYANCGCG